MHNSSSAHFRQWCLLLFFACLAAGLVWSRSHHLAFSLGTGIAVIVFGRSLVIGHSAVSAYTHVLDKSADAARAPQQTAAYQVRRLLTRFRYEGAVEGLADLALNQLKLIEGHYEHFEKSLGTKLNEGELTYERYHTAGSQAYEGIMENLRIGASLIEQITRARNSETVTKLETIFNKNDEALHGFERINAALENMSSKGAPERLQAAITDLEILAQQAHKYAASEK